MTSKEALEKIGSTTYYDWNNKPLSEHFKEEFEMIKKSLTELEEYKQLPVLHEVAIIPEANLKLSACELQLRELKRYPTADEVCKALSKHLKYIVTYYENAFEISYGTKNKEYVAYYIDYLGTKIEKILPPHLIPLIGKFYEGLEKAGKEE